MTAQKTGRHPDRSIKSAGRQAAMILGLSRRASTLGGSCRPQACLELLAVVAVLPRSVLSMKATAALVAPIQRRLADVAVVWRPPPALSPFKTVSGFAP